jgi:hypothetical protein
MQVNWRVQRMKKFLCILGVLLLSACSSGLDRKIDGSSEAKFESSLAAMKKGAKPQDIARLDEALMVLAVSDVSIGYEGGILGALNKLSRGKSPEQLADALMPLVGGKTGREIIAAGQQRRQKEAGRQLAAAMKEMAELNQVRDESSAKRGALQGIEILEPTLRFSSDGPEKISVLDFKVRNASTVGLTYLFMRGTVSEFGTNRTLVSEDINYKLSESPLLPGETKALRLPTSTRGKWNAPEVWGKENLMFRIDMINAEDLGGRKLTTAFTAKDAARLTTLEANKLALEKMLAAD